MPILYQNSVAWVEKEEEFFVAIPDRGRHANAHLLTEFYEDSLEEAISTCDSWEEDHKGYLT